jgi:hypothetical protein
MGMGATMDVGIGPQGKFLNFLHDRDGTLRCGSIVKIDPWAIVNLLVQNGKIRSDIFNIETHHQKNFDFRFSILECAFIQYSLLTLRTLLTIGTF